MNWFDYEICVPFGNPRYDVGLGGPHDMDVRTPPNTPITALLPGEVVDIGEPTWGMVIGVKLDTPYKGIPYMAYLHLAAVNVKLHDHIVPGQLIAWSGGCTAAAQYRGTSNPTNRSFLNTPNMSSQPQTGIAIMRGPIYGSGLGWENFPDVDWSLDPTQIILDARKNNEGEDFMPIDIHTPGISNEFEETDAHHWRSKKTGKVIQFGMLAEFKAKGYSAGWGHPMSNEIYYAPGKSKQHWETCVTGWDKATGKVTLLPLYTGGPGTDPELVKLQSAPVADTSALQAQLDAAIAALAQSNKQVVTLQQKIQVAEDALKA